MSALKRPTLVSSLLVRKGAATPTGQTSQSGQLEIHRVAPRPVVAVTTDHPMLTAPPYAKTIGGRKFGRRPAQPTTDRHDRSDGKKMRLSLGLDSQLHLRLKLAAVHNGTNMRELVLTAIDHYLVALAPAIQDGRCACLQADAQPTNCAHKDAGSKNGIRTDRA